jgi:hypothetical protein
MSTTIAERVAKGAALLDEKIPGWADRIDLHRFYIGSTCDCVLGQLHDGSYTDGMYALTRDTEDHGFMWTASPADAGAEEAEIAELETEWRRVIEARRAGEAR